MSSAAPTQLRSKAFRDGGMIRMLDFAVRGLPSHYMLGEQRLDRDLAIKVYWPELQLLDALGIQSRWFWSGSVGAALVSLALWPDSLDLWRQLALHRIRRDERGADAPCFLMELIYRHQDDERLTRSPAFQLHVFQQSLAVAQACADQGDYTLQFQHLPPMPDIVELLDEVRQVKGQRHTMMGFRPTRILRKWWVEPETPQVIHSASLKEARALADSAASIRGRKLSAKALDGAENWIAAHNPPNELSHPAALAAALVTVAEDAACWPLWAASLSNHGLRQPSDQGRPLKDTATRMQDAIVVANRQKEPVHSAVLLFNRLCTTIKRWHTTGERLLTNLPRGAVNRDPELVKAWSRLSVPLTPELRFDSQPQRASPASEFQDGELPLGDDANLGCQTGNRKPGSRVARRLKTGLKGEKWLMANYKELFPQYEDGTLRNCRRKCEGYDFALVRGRERLFIEVKAVQGESGSIHLEDLQWKKAHQEGSRYYLVVVFDISGDNSAPLVIQDPASVLDPKRKVAIKRSVNWLVDASQLSRLIAQQGGSVNDAELKVLGSDSPT